MKLVGEKKAEWDEHIDSCVYAYNTSSHESTLYPPFQLMLGRTARLPIDVEMEEEAPEDMLLSVDENNTRDVDILTQRRQQDLQKAKDNILAAQDKLKSRAALERARTS